MLESLRRALILWLGGFADIDSAIRHIKETQDADRKALILAEAVKRLYNAIGPEDILRQVEGGQWTYKGKPITGTELTHLKREAATLREMSIWKVIRTDIRYQLGKKMFEEARVKDDLVWGQLLVFLDDIIRARLKSM